MKNILILLLCCCLQGVCAQTTSKIQILFWNVENLFDIQNDTLKNDEDFLPGSLRHWTSYRYYHKLQQLSKAIITAGAWNPPAIIGLSEVENDSVIYDLIHRTGLRNLNYQFVITHSADLRGIDVTLLYQPDLFKLLFSEEINVGNLPIGRRPTRNILQVRGVVASGDTLDVFVVHCPSRYGGAKYSEPNRMHVCQVLKAKVDSLFLEHPHAKPIIMGDFNDYPNNKSLSEVLAIQNPTTPNIQNTQLYHLLAFSESAKQGLGTYKYKNSWGILDHILVGGGLLDTLSTCRVTDKQAQVVNSELLLIPDEKYGGRKPFRTYNGMRYQGGYSDHLPIIFELELIL